ncbi:histidine phosphotransferase family protein [Dankookia sp. GCM10030260]|uniref:histidine phosphotransferase family protein n=1 Tax=Dankookia sp. GCM10030260 TaxID=3273390 RepID=UPI00360CEE4B
MRMDAQLARTLAARICHDLGGAAGTLSGTLDLVGEGDAGMLDLARDTATELRQRLRLFAAAWGGGAAATDAAGLAQLLAAAPAAPRVGFRLDHLAPGAELPAALVPLALNAALLGAESLPRGGTVTLAGAAAEGLVVCLDGRDAAWPAGLLALLGGARPDTVLREGPRRVLAPLLLALAAEAGWALSLAQGAGAPPLLLGPG